MAIRKPSESNLALATIVNIIFDHGPISAFDIGEKLGRSQEYAGTYIRQARALELVHIKARGDGRKKMYPVRLYVFGKGKDSMAPLPKPKKKWAPKPKEVFVPRHDDAMLAFFGRAL
jgi:hypothetical protein